MDEKSCFNFSKKVVLVTGGGTGLGFEISRALIQSGAKVVITGRRERVLCNACESLGKNSNYIVNDITELNSLPDLVDKVENEQGAIDILVNNAGINSKKHILQVSDEEFNNIIQTNLTAVFALSREAAKKMKQRKSGSIIMITSMAALYGIPNVTAYSASKSGVLGFTRALSVDLAPYNIRVNAIAPGFIDSPMLRKAFDADHDRKKRVLERTPLNSLGNPEDVANAVLFLASDAAKFITGVNLPVDGGNSIGF